MYESTGKAESMDKAVVTMEGLLQLLRPRVKVEGPPQGRRSCLCYRPCC